MVMDSLAEKSALVTGASSGIGRQTALALAADGASVALAARRTERLEAVADRIESEYDGRAHVVPTDVSEADEVDAMVDSTVEEFGSLDIVVNSAAVSILEDVESMDTETFETMLDVNVRGMFLVARAVIPHLRETAGNLIMVGSYSSQHPIPAHPVYAASKWWGRGFSLSLAGQIGDDGIGVTVVHPSEVRTELGGSEDRRPTKDRYEPGEITEPEDVAATIVFAAKQESPNTISELDIFRRDKFSSGNSPSNMQ